MKNKVYSSDHISRVLGVFIATISLIIFVSAFTKMTWGIAFLYTYIFGLAGYWILLPLMLVHGLSILFKGEKFNKGLSWKVVLGLVLALVGVGFIFGYISAKYYSANSLNLYDYYGTYSVGLKAEFAKGKGYIDINDGGGIIFTILASLLNSVSDALTITLFVVILLTAIFFLFYPFIMRFAHFASGKYAMHKIKKEALEAQKASEEEERKSLEDYIEENKPIEINDEINNIAEFNQVSPEKVPEEPIVTRSSLYHGETTAEISPVPQETKPVEPITFSDETFDTSLKEAVFDINGGKEAVLQKKEEKVKQEKTVSEYTPSVPSFDFSPKTEQHVEESFSNDNVFSEPKADETSQIKNETSLAEAKRTESYVSKPIEPIVTETVEKETIPQMATFKQEETKDNVETSNIEEQSNEESTQINYAANDESDFEKEEEEMKPAKNESVPTSPAYVQGKFIEVPEEEKTEEVQPEPVKEPEPEDPLKGMPKAKERPEYQLPPTELLRTVEKDPQIEAENMAQCAIRMETINQAITAFGIGAQAVSFTIGPSVTRYDIQFKPGVRASSLNGYISDICRSLGGLNARYEEVIMGKTTSGLEIPNEKASTVSFKELIQAMPTDPKNSMMIPFGVNISGEKMFADLSKFPHMLIAGGTGSGKSVYANSVLATLIMRNRPEDLKLVLIDPKKVEMSKYKDIPHLLCPIITEPSQAKVCLDKLVDEMERRYSIFAITGAKDIRTFNTKCAPKAGLEPMPFIVTFIDEYANLVDSIKSVSDPVAQIAAKARAAGIHLIVATQRPAVNVITGNIKANLDVRVALKVNASQDSQTVLGRGGAEQLNGNGDMLVQCSLISKGGDFIRCQGCYLQDEEIDAIVDFVKSQQKVSYDPYFSDLVDHSQDAKIAEETDKMERAAQREHEKSDRYEMIKADIMCQEYTSISKIQRNYGMGYPMAQKVFARLQAEGIVAQAESQSSSKGAKVLVHDDTMYRNGSETFYGDND